VIKLIPLALIPYLLVRRHIRLLLAAAAVALLGVALGLVVTSPTHSLHYFRDMLPQLSAGSGYRENESLSGLASRLCNPASAEMGGNGGWCGRTVAWPAIAAVLGLVMVATRQRRRPGLEFGLAVAALPLVSSVTWGFHLVLLLLPIALLLHHHFRVARLPRGRVRVLLLAWLCFSVLPGVHYLLVFRPLPPGLGTLVTRVVAESYLLGTLLLFAVIWQTVRQAARTQADQVAAAAAA
jgi:glycosyl transferase family 87